MSEPVYSEVSERPKRVPTKKVNAAAAGGALATVLVITLQWLTGMPVPPGLEGALATLFAFAAGYVAKD